MDMKTLCNRAEEKVRQTVLDNESLVALFELVVCEAIAAMIPLPCESVELPKSFFLVNHQKDTLNQLSQLNEYHVIDVDHCASLVFEIWRIRYSLLHEVSSKRYGRLLNAVAASPMKSLSEPYISLVQRFPNVTVTDPALESKNAQESRDELRRV